MSVDTAHQLSPDPGTAVAIHAWFVPHDPAAACPGLNDPVRPLRQAPCFEGRDWLLDEPEELWSDPTKVGIDRQPAAAALNPIIPFDVPFDVGPVWSGATPTPVPVVVLGHFDSRVMDPYRGASEYVVDALVWAHGRTVPEAPIVRVAHADEPADQVVERIDAAVPPPAITSWLTVLTGSDLEIAAPDAARRAPELARTDAVWVVRRLVEEYREQGPVRTIGSAYTADGGTRVWWDSACCGLDLATTIDVHFEDPTPAVVRVIDEGGAVVAARPVGGEDAFTWRRIGPADLATSPEVAAGTSPNELAVRWSGRRCQDVVDLRIRTGDAFGDGVWLDPRAFLEQCRGNVVRRGVVLTFDRAIDLDRVEVDDDISGG
jgi:hypothetical protein